MKCCVRPGSILTEVCFQPLPDLCCGRLQNAAARWYSEVLLHDRTAGRVHMHLKSRWDPGAINIPSIPAWFFVSLREFGPSADANSVTMEAFVEALAATEQTPAETFHAVDISVLILVVFEERWPCRFSSGAVGRGFIFGSTDRNDDVEEKDEKAES